MKATLNRMFLTTAALALALVAAPALAQVKIRYAHVGEANAPQTL